MKVVVVGSNSFSGSDFIDYLLTQTDADVKGFSRSPEKPNHMLCYNKEESNRFNFEQLDLNQDMTRFCRVLDEIQPDYIVNFAAQSEVAPSWDHPDQWFQTNAVSITALANYLKDVSYLKKYVHISSPEVYGSCEGVVTEEAPLNPSTPYAASKAAGDLSLFTYVKNYNFPMTMIRATNVYGPCQQLFKIIVRSIIYIKLGQAIQLHGGGEAVKSYIHIRDVSRGEFLAMTKGDVGEIYHLSPDKGISVKEVVRIICEKMKVDMDQVTEVVGERLGQDAAYVIDSTKARQQLGWKPKISFEEGLGQVVDWVDRNWEKIRESELNYVHKI